jgi:hypothetical protein
MAEPLPNDIDIKGLIVTLISGVAAPLKKQNEDPFISAEYDSRCVLGRQESLEDLYLE